jgi:Protein of unknown function (DUF3761)/Protein of unknown function (DUF1524)
VLQRPHGHRRNRELKDRPLAVLVAEGRGLAGVSEQLLPARQNSETALRDPRRWGSWNGDNAATLQERAEARRSKTMSARLAIGRRWLTFSLSLAIGALLAANLGASDSASAVDVHSAVGIGTAAGQLSALLVKGKAPMTGYNRTGDFGAAWLDENHNRCDTRDDILARDLKSILRSGLCKVVSGALVSPYTGATIHFIRGVKTSALVQIDHLVSLGDAWQTGAQQLSKTGRELLANDPLELLAVDGKSNDQKGDGDAATWLPANKSFRCEYVARQISVKVTYGLWVTPAEKAAMSRVLATCPNQTAYVSQLARGLKPTQITTATPTASAPAPVVVAPPAPAPVAPAPAPAIPAGATARCNDGTYSFAAHHQGACSHHQGVAQFYN